MKQPFRGAKQTRGALVISFVGRQKREVRHDRADRLLFAQLAQCLKRFSIATLCPQPVALSVCRSAEVTQRPRACQQVAYAAPLTNALLEQPLRLLERTLGEGDPTEIADQRCGACLIAKLASERQRLPICVICFNKQAAPPRCIPDHVQRVGYLAQVADFASLRQAYQSQLAGPFQVAAQLQNARLADQQAGR